MKRGGLAGAGLITLAIGGFGAAVNLVLALLIARHLGAAGAGVYFAVVAVATVAANTAELGVDTAFVRFVSAARARRRLSMVPLWLRSIRWPLAISGSLVMGGAAVLAAIGRSPVDFGTTVAVAAAAVALSWTAVALSLARGFADTWSYPLTMSLLVPALRLAGVGVVIAWGLGVQATVLAWATPIFVALIVALLVATRRVRRDVLSTEAGPEQVDDDVRTFWRFSAARGLGAAVEIALEWIDVVLVSILAGPAAAGVYAVVTRIVRASEIVQQAARIVISPVVSGAFARGDRDGVSALQSSVAAAMIWLAWPFFALVAVFGDVLLGWFGSSFGSGWTALVILSAAVALQVATGPLQSIVLMAGNSSWQVMNKSAALVLMVVLDLLLIPGWGATGAAVAWAAALLLETVVACVQVFGLLSIPARVVQPAASAAIALTVTVGSASVVRSVVGADAWGMAAAIAVAGALVAPIAWATRERWGLSTLLRTAVDA